MERSEIRELTPRQESRIALRSIRATGVRTHVIAPCLVRPQGLPVILVLTSDTRGVRNDRAFHRARGARMVWMRAARMPLSRHTGSGPAQRRRSLS